MYLKLCDVCGFRPNMVTTLCADQDKIWRERAHYRPVQGQEMKWGGVFFCKKWTFPQRRVHYVQYQYFLSYILLIGGA